MTSDSASTFSETFEWPCRRPTKTIGRGPCARGGAACRPTDGVSPGSSPRRGSCRARSPATNARRPSRRTLPRRTMRLGLPRLGRLLTSLWRLDLLGLGWRGGRSPSGLTASADRPTDSRQFEVAREEHRPCACSEADDAEGGRIRSACSRSTNRFSSWRRTVRIVERDPAAEVRSRARGAQALPHARGCQHRAGMQ